MSEPTGTAHAVYYRRCGHVIMANSDRATLDALAKKITGVAVRIAASGGSKRRGTDSPARCVCVWCTAQRRVDQF